MKNIKVLVLEDDLETLEYIFRVLKEVSIEKEIPIGVTTLPDYKQTDLFINKNPYFKYDILLLDRDCFLGGSFQVVNLDLFNKDKIISISSVPDYNKKAGEMGVTRFILKDYKNLDKFSGELKEEILKLV